MFSKIATASVVALGTSQVRGNWLEDELLPAVGEVFDQTERGVDTVLDVVGDLVDDSAEEEHGLKGKIAAKLAKGIHEAMTKKDELIDELS